MCKKSCELYDTDFDRGGFVGVAIAGYGEEEIYPHLVHLHIGGVIDTKLKYNIIENVELIDKIIVHAPDKSSGERIQQIDIRYNFIGEVEFSAEYATRTTA